MLTLQVCGGLCNRLGAINSAAFLCQQEVRQLQVVWQRYELLNCRFEDLFLPSPFFQVIESDWKLSWFLRQLDKLSLFFKYTKYISLQKYEALLANGGSTVSDFLQKHDAVYMLAYHSFGDVFPYTSVFKPILEIQQRIDEISTNFDKHTIGLHIRLTDRVQFSAKRVFVRIIENELSQNPSTKFFLATDELPFERHLQSLFGTAIIVQPDKDFARNTKKGIQDALVDLICLAKTQKIFGSCESSFSKIAAQWHGAPLVMLEPDES